MSTEKVSTSNARSTVVVGRPAQAVLLLALLLLLTCMCSGPPATRGVVILPGLANNAADYAELADHLRGRGLETSVVQVMCRLTTCYSTFVY